MVGRSTWILALILAAAMAMATRHADAISCPEAIVDLSPCQPYLVGKSSTLTAQCCQAASKLNSMVHDKPDLRNLCSCLKQAAAAMHVIVDRAKGIPADCHIQVPVPIDPNVDCSRI